MTTRYFMTMVVSFLAIVGLLYHFPDRPLPAWAGLLTVGLVVVCIGSFILILVSLEPEDAD